MKEVGFIGYGHMGSVMLKSLLFSGAIEPNQLVISTRTKSKLEGLKRAYPEIELADNNSMVARESSSLFLCVGTYQVKPVLEEIKEAFHKKTHLMIISGGLEIASVERLFGGPITKIIPTLISEVQEGVTLMCHNSKVATSERDNLFEMFGKIGKVKVIPECQFEMGSDFTSCAPGLLASICDQFVRAAVAQSDFTYEEGSEMLLQTLYGTAKLLLQNGEDFKGLIERVARPGGATEGGIEVLEAHLPEAFKKVFAATVQRHEVRKEKTRQQFG